MARSAVAKEVLLQGVALGADFRDGTLRLARLDAEIQGPAPDRDRRGRSRPPDVVGRAGCGMARRRCARPLRGDPPRSPAAAGRAPGGPTGVRGAEGEALPDARRTTRLARSGRCWIEASLETKAGALRSVRGRAEVRGLGFSVQGVPLRQDQPFTIELENGRLTLPEVSWKGGETDLRLGGGILLAEDVARLHESALDLRAQRGPRPPRAQRAGPGPRGGRRGPPADGRDRHLRPARSSWATSACKTRSSPTGRGASAWTISPPTSPRKPGQIAVESLSGTLNGGSLTGRGVLELGAGRPRRGEVEVEIAGANVDWPEGFRGSLDGTLALRGTDAGPVLAGDLTPGQRGLPGRSADPRHAEAATLGGEAEGPTALSGLGLDLRLRTEPDVRVDNPFGVFAFSVDVTARGTAAAPRLLGQVTLQPKGFVYWSGRQVHARARHPRLEGRRAASCPSCRPGPPPGSRATTCSPTSRGRWPRPTRAWSRTRRSEATRSRPCSSPAAPAPEWPTLARWASSPRTSSATWAATPASTACASTRATTRAC